MLRQVIIGNLLSVKCDTVMLIQEYRPFDAPGERPGSRALFIHKAFMSTIIRQLYSSYWTASCLGEVFAVDYNISFFFFKDEFYSWQRNSESPYSSSKLIRHPGLFAQVNSTGRGVPPPPSTGSIQLLCQCFFQAHAGSTQQLSNWLVWSAHADTLGSRPPAGICVML